MSPRVFFFCTPVECLNHLWLSGQLCHILSTAVTHFLFPFQINLLTSFTAFTYKKNKKNNPRLSFQAAIPKNLILVRHEDLWEITASVLSPGFPPPLLFSLVYRPHLLVPFAKREEQVEKTVVGNELRNQGQALGFFEATSDIHQHGNMF